MSETVSTRDDGLFISKKRKLPRSFSERPTSAKRQKLVSGLPESNLPCSNTLQDSIAQYKTIEGVSVQSNRSHGNTSYDSTRQTGTPRSKIPQITVPVKEHKTKPRDFFDLPAEIRIQIYELVLVERGKQVWPGQDKAPPTSIVRRFDRIYRANSQQSSVITPALLAVNSQIHNEASPVLYGQPLNFSQVVTLDGFLGGIGTSTSLIKHIILQKWRTNAFPIKITNKLFRLGSGSKLRLDSLTFRLHESFHTKRLHDSATYVENCFKTCTRLVEHSGITDGMIRGLARQQCEDKDGTVFVYVDRCSTRAVNSKVVSKD